MTYHRVLCVSAFFGPFEVSVHVYRKDTAYRSVERNITSIIRLVGDVSCVIQAFNMVCHECTRNKSLHFRLLYTEHRSETYAIE